MAKMQEQVAELGTAVSIARQETVALLQQMIQDQTDEALPFPQAKLALEGAFEAETAGLSASDREEHYRRRLSDGRSRDRAAGRTLNGPHLSDLKVRHAAKDMPAAQSSTGEQKALLVGIVLANAGLEARLGSGVLPVLLLDEVAAHLDAARRAALFEEILAHGIQAWMTGTDDVLFEALESRAQFYHVSEGRADARGPARV